MIERFMPALLVAAVIGATAAGAVAAPGDDKLIASAIAAAPKALAANATVVAMNPDGSMRELRKGTNGITCMPDDPEAPGPSAMCLDANAMRWAGAWMAHKTPPNVVGFVYMLAGGTDASNTDPYATKPKDGKWVRTGPHVMIVGPAAAAMPGYPSGGAHPNTAKPYTMFGGTPYAHLMIPVK